MTDWIYEYPDGSKLIIYNQDTVTGNTPPKVIEPQREELKGV